MSDILLQQRPNQAVAGYADVVVTGPENHQSDVYLGQSLKTSTVGYADVYLYGRPTAFPPIRPTATSALTFTGQATGVVTGFLFARTIHQGEPVTNWGSSAAIAADGQMYGVVTANYRNRGDIATLKSLNPNLRVLCYFDPMASDSTDTGGDNSGVDYAIANNGSNNSWFLLQSGSRILHTSESTAWMMDIGSRAYQNAVIANVLSHVQDGTPWDGIFFDEFGVSTSFAGFSSTPDFYPTEASWQSALTSFLTYVVPQLRAAGFKVITNLADDYNSSPTGLEVSKAIIDLSDGYFEESWTDGGAGLAQQNPWTPYRIQAMQYAVSVGKIAYTHSHNTTEAGQTYALALNMCFADQNTFHDTAWPDYTSEGSIPEYTTAMSLRFPLGAATVLDSGGSQGTSVYMREFQGGVVLANCETADFGPVSLGGTYSGSGLTGVTAVTIPAKTGYILLPEAAVVGAGAGTISFTGSAAGTASRHLFSGTAAGVIAVTGAVTGTAHNHVISGSAAGTITLTGAASGIVHDHVFSGTAAGTITFTGTATGHDIEHGAASSTITFTGLAAGTAHDHVFVGSAAGTVAFTGTAAGHILEHGTAAGTVAFTGAAAGTAHDHVFSGTAVGTVNVTGSAAGSVHDHVITGSASGSVTVTGLAAGSASVHTDIGSAASTFTVTGLAAGIPRSSVSTTDSASGSDTHSLVVIHQRGENGSISESSVLNVIFNRTEVSVGTSVSLLGTVSTNNESGTSSETSFEHATFAYVDTGSGVEASSIIVSNFLVRLDSASGTEVASHSAAYVLTDVGTDYEKGVNSSHPVITIPLVIFEGGRIKVWLSGTAGDSIYYE